MREVSAISLAYIAGLFDGEGYVGVTLISRPANKVKKGLRLHIAIVNTYKPVLDWGVEVTGIGRVYSHNKGCDGRLPTFQWALSDYAAEQFLRAVLPYLQIKAEQSRMALEFRSLGQARPGMPIPPENYARALELKECMRQAKGFASPFFRSSITN